MTEHPVVTICGNEGPKLPLVGKPKCLRQPHHDGPCVGILGHGPTVAPVVFLQQGHVIVDQDDRDPIEMEPP